MGFHSRREVKARKNHLCEQCQTKIEAGIAHVYTVGAYYGDFYCHRQHVECDAAGQAYAALHALDGEEWPWFSGGEISCEPDSRKWMKEQHPLVYERLGWARLDEWEPD